MKSVPEFLAHAVVLEEEAAERYEQLAEATAAHDNEPATELFRTMAHFARKHMEQTLARARDAGALPELKPWEYEWPGGESPEAWVLAEEVDYSMTPADALRLALSAEQLAHAFYAEVARTAGNAEVKALAQVFADEEAGHVEEIERWLDRHPDADADWGEGPYFGERGA